MKKLFRSILRRLDKEEQMIFDKLIKLKFDDKLDNLERSFYLEDLNNQLNDLQSDRAAIKQLLRSNIDSFLVGSEND